MPLTPGETDRAMIARVEARDADALASLYDLYAARLLGLAARILGDTGEAEEVLQEVFPTPREGAFSPGSSWRLEAARSTACAPGVRPRGRA